MSDQTYIDTVRDQINSGTYHHLISDICFIDDAPKSDMVVLDIGANTGEVSKYFAPYCKRVVALEPAPETFKMLVKNTNVPHGIECLQLALAPIDGPVEFFVNDINFTASSTVNTYGSRIMVEGRRLSTILEIVGEPVDVCKIDAEGAEGESLNYDQIKIASGIVKTFYVEVHNCPKTTWEHKLGTLVGNFARCGYTKMKIDGMAITATK